MPSLAPLTILRKLQGQEGPLVVTDGEDNAAAIPRENDREVQKTTRDLHHRLARSGKQEGSQARPQGARAKLPLPQVAWLTSRKMSMMCTTSAKQVAHDIRNQYILAYYPATLAVDGTFRASTVDVILRGAVANSLPAPATATMRPSRRLPPRQLTIHEDSHPGRVRHGGTSRRISPRRRTKRRLSRTKHAEVMECSDCLCSGAASDRSSVPSANCYARTSALPHMARISNPLVHGPDCAAG